MQPSQEFCEVTPLLIDGAVSPLSPQSPLSASFTSVLPYHKDSGILSEAEAKKAQKALADGNLLEVVFAAIETLRRVPSTRVNIAVTGDSGNGMSTFINALRGIGHEEEASAPTGVVRTTQTRASYSFSCFPDVVLWDLPGMGATSQSLEDYIVEMQFSQYDLFIIIASEQFSMNHVMLAKAIEEMGKKFYIVWTKLDMDLSTRMLTEGQLMKNIRENILENLQKTRVRKPPIFLISSLEPSWHDFPKLRDTLKEDLSDIRYHGPLQNLFHAYKEIINDKVTYLQEKIATNSFQNTPGMRDIDDLAECLKTYRLSFGVNDESLQQLARSMGKESSEYKAIMKSQDLQAVITRGWKLKCLTCRVMKMFLILLSYIPSLDALIAPYIRQEKHNRMLEGVAEDTMTVLKKVLKDFTSS
ncbi:immunity-related GTPase family M protein 1-like isoform X1 [Trichechus manatus latirostris]|uniref:Immunity-related GTPase family M protein 1-like isoform X1 n=1 Tax=Trichechus manatus latirostris TaxID=127582 RepID=A0A2Y9RI80_TRIMA|nr:immunity-related GTPase family M protein 1-like isoform X1 [Trichechus manatus latirostris]